MAIKQLTFLNNNPPAADDNYLNSIVGEVNNTIAAYGISLNDFVLTQLSSAISIATSKGDFYEEGAGSAADAYVLQATGSQAALSAYQDGMRIRFKVVNTNTGASTIDIDTLGAKTIEYGGAALSAGMITAGNQVVVKYDSTSDKFNLEYVLSSDDLFVDPATGNVGVGTTAPNRKLTIDSNDAESLIDSTNITWSANQLTAFGNKASEYSSTESSTLADGGRVVSGYTKEASATASGIRSNAYTENEPTTLGAHNLDTFKHDGAGGLTSIADGSRLFSLRNNGVDKTVVYGNGDIHIAGDESLYSTGITWSANQLSAFSTFAGEYERLESISTTDGGARLNGYTKLASGTANGVSLNAYTENETTTLGAHKLDVFKHNGAGALTNIADASRLFSIHNNGVEKFRVMGNGDLFISGAFGASGASSFSNSIKAYVSFNGTTTTPTIYRSYRISNIIRNGTGDYTINFSVSMGTTRYTVMGMGSGGGRILGILSTTATQLNLQIQSDQGTNTTSDPVTFAIV